MAVKPRPLGSESPRSLQVAPIALAGALALLAWKRRTEQVYPPQTAPSTLEEDARVARASLFYFTRRANWPSNWRVFEKLPCCNVGELKLHCKLIHLSVK